MRIPAAPGRGECRVRGSRFLALAAPVSSLEQALDVRDGERRTYHDATHHVFAARLASGESRSDDDGEPAGTAGRPILSLLEAAELVNAVLVVTRYFGGTKLGPGGLARAYGDAGRAALAAVTARSVAVARILHILYSHPDTGFVTRALAAANGRVESTRYGDRVHIEVAVAETMCEDLCASLVNVTAGRIEVSDSGKTGLVTVNP
ncbi:MAG: YigZ family protein [Gemmatimonadota bacterium]